jgi:hypothetical protein
MKNLNLILIATFILVTVISNCTAQQKTVQGSVYAFKDLALNKIQINAAKAKTVAVTDSLGRFRIKCEPDDKLEFSGFGFNKVIVKLKDQKPLKVKMIFKGGPKNENLAVENGHVSKADLVLRISTQSDQNYEYYNYPDILSAISKIYASDDKVKVGGGGVYIRSGNSSFSNYPAIFIVNGKLALDLSNIVPRDIESIELMPDGSKQYGPGAANGVVLVKTVNK